MIIEKGDLTLKIGNNLELFLVGGDSHPDNKLVIRGVEIAKPTSIRALQLNIDFSKKDSPILLTVDFMIQ